MRRPSDRWVFGTSLLMLGIGLLLAWLVLGKI
jgi:hypothetical protein